MADWTFHPTVQSPGVPPSTIKTYFQIQSTGKKEDRKHKCLNMKSSRQVVAGLSNPRNKALIQSFKPPVSWFILHNSQGSIQIFWNWGSEKQEARDSYPEAAGAETFGEAWSTWDPFQFYVPGKQLCSSLGIWLFPGKGILPRKVKPGQNKASAEEVGTWMHPRLESYEKLHNLNVQTTKLSLPTSSAEIARSSPAWRYKECSKNLTS